jgi:hypothetical protein
LPKHTIPKAVFPAAVAALPLVVEAVRAATTGAGIWLWGDQALIDMEARDSILGRNLLGVYDRYGWHHLGPLWLLLLGAFRWLGGGSVASLIVGSYAVQAAAAAAIVLMAYRLAGRLGPGLAAWWAALLVVGFEWTFGLARLGTVWAPYAIALPAALLVLLVADVVANDNPWPSAVGVAACASFLCQTEISTGLTVAALVLAAPVLRTVSQVRRQPATPRAGPKGRRLSTTAGWAGSTGKWPVGLAALVAVLVVVWLPTAIQQLSTNPGNLVQVFDFFTSHTTHHTWQDGLRAADTVFGAFPFSTGIQPGSHDAELHWLIVHSPWSRPWYPGYIALTAAVAVVAAVRRRRAAFALAATSGVALVAAGLSIPLVFGPLFPYLVIWMGAIVVPVWVACWLTFTPTPTAASGERLPVLARLGVPRRWAALSFPGVGVAAAATVSCLFALSPVPMTGMPSALGRHAWKAVAAQVSSPDVKTVYIDVADKGAMPDAAAIADQVIRHGRRVEVDPGALYFVDPSFTPGRDAQLEVVVCCGRKSRHGWLPGMKWRAKVGDQQIYTLSERGPRPALFTLGP